MEDSAGVFKEHSHSHCLSRCCTNFGLYDKLGSLLFMAGKSTVCGIPHVSLGPGQPRLDSGSLSPGWFPLPDAVARACGLPPICPLQSVFDVP